MLECMLFGSLISATDPVTVLAVFQSLKVEINMYSLVFGESVMNDAVAIVLYRSLLTFKTEPVSASSIAGSLGLFLVIFVGSFLIGGVVGLLSALVFKNGSFRRLTETDRDSVLEAALVCVPYIAYILAEGLQLSGIVSILFCGIVMKRYTNESLSHDARETYHSFFQSRRAWRRLSSSCRWASRCSLQTSGGTTCCSSSGRCSPSSWRVL